MATHRLLVYPVLAVTCSALAPRVAVFGGSGFIGSRVCEALASAGCRVVSVSRAGAPPRWAAETPWAAGVEWIAADMLDDAAAPELGGLDAAVSCVGNVRPEPGWAQFWGLHWDDDAKRRENGYVNERVVDAAARAGARKFAYVSVSNASQLAFGGALEGYIDGKIAAENAARARFGADNAVFVGPSLVYGGGRFAAAGALAAAALRSPPVRAYFAVNDALRGLSAGGKIEVGDVASVFLAPPAPVEAVAAAVAAGALGATDATRVDGTDEIEALARGAGAKAALAAAVAAAAESEWDDAPSRAEPAGAAAARRRALPDAPFEGALVGSRPFLYPLPVLAFFAAVWTYISE